VIGTEALASIESSVLGNFAGECAAYARSRVPSLPGELFTMQVKLRIVNSNQYCDGSVAITRDGNVGHVAVDDKCDRDGKKEGITITEANWRSGMITRREASIRYGLRVAEAELAIAGYWRP
jgi:hypothetical protein